MAKQKATRQRSGRGRVIAYTIAALIALAGLADATYLTVQALTGETAVCGHSSDCFKVLGSNYARIGNIPLASFGVLGYFGAFCCALLAAFNYTGAARCFRWLVGAMFLATLWLLFVQAFLLHAFCPFCLFSAAMTFILTGIAVALPANKS